MDQNQEEGWEVQDGSTRIRKVVNSGHILTEVEGEGEGSLRVNKGL